MRRGLAAALMLGLLLGGCTRANDRAAAPAGELDIAQQREPMSLNPALENGASSTEWSLLLFQYLVKWDDKGQLIGDAATEVPTLRNGGISKDGLTITYHLRPDLRFSDGMPLTAADCVWSIRAIQNPANNVQSRYGYDRVRAADAPDAHTLVLHLTAPFAPLLTLVLAPQGFPILPEHVLEKETNFNHIAFDEKPIGSGPYVVDSWSHGDRVTMHANPYYWKGKPSIERLVVRFVNDPNTAINMLRTGEIGGFFNDQDLGTYQLLRSIPGVRVSNVASNAVVALIFNTQDPMTRDPRVRHALAEALDIHRLIAKSYRGALTADAAGRGLFLWAYDAKAYPDVPYDPTHANALLASAGWKMGSDGVRHKNALTLDPLLILQAQTPGDQIVAEVIASEEHAVGARVSLKQYTETQYVAPASEGGPVYGGQFQMALYPFVNGDDPDTTDQFSCSHVPPNGYNKSRLCDPAVDALLDRARTTYDMPIRKQLYAKLQARLYADMPVLLLAQRRELDAFTDRLRGQSTSASGAFWNVGAWSLAP